MGLDYCGLPGYTGPLPGDPDLQDSWIAATTGFTGIQVRWGFPVSLQHAVAHVQLYRSASNSFGAATQIEVVNGSSFFDRQNNVNTYYYWIKIVSVNGTVGTEIGPASAQARLTIEDILADLTDQITSSKLGVALRANIADISIINANWLDEVFDRETGQTSLSQAIADAEAGIAQAHTFISTEIASRITVTSALAEQIDVVAATLGGDYGAVTVAMQVEIDALTGYTYALWGAKVDVNGYVGGFGMQNNGFDVLAVFDVDTFAVGRNGATSTYPFIISGGQTFIKEAVIQDLTFSKLKDAGGNFIVQDGRIQADHITVNNASIQNASITTLKIGQNQVTFPNGAMNTAMAILPEVTTWIPLASYGVTLESGATTFMSFNCAIDNEYRTQDTGFDLVNNYSKWELRYIDSKGNTYLSNTGSLQIYEANMATTNHTFLVEGRISEYLYVGSQSNPDNGCEASYRNIFIIECKR
jgi:hypothetical protein